MKTVIGIIGYGNMGSTIAQQCKESYQVIVFDKDKTKTGNLAQVKIADNIESLIEQGHAIILAVKPQDFSVLLSEIKDCVRNKLIISVAAGITTEYIEKYLGPARIIRAMPNLLAKIRKGTTFLYKGEHADWNNIRFAEEIFGHLGQVQIIREDLMNAATAVSGSGPACCCDIFDTRSIDYHNVPPKERNRLIDDLKHAAVSVGFDYETAEILADSIVNGTIDLLNIANITPLELRRQVTSKGGTTQAALEILDKGGSLEEAIRAAVKRAEELSKKE